MKPTLDVVIVGAGAAGIGIGLLLQTLGVERFALLERHEVGASFRRWPRETRFITPSFYSNPFGLADLNAISPTSSPAISCRAEHPSGDSYARYLEQLVERHQLPLIGQCEVRSVTPLSAGGFEIDTDQGSGTARYVVWATGEYQFPDLTPFAGAELCRHYARVDSWSDLAGADHCVIGGYESGVDAAIHLVRLGCRVRLLARKPTWQDDSPLDPSLSLSPYSRERLEQALETGRLEVAYGVDVVTVERNNDWYRILAADGRVWLTDQPPVLGTGFVSGGGARQVEALFDWNEAGLPILSECDESTRTPGLFLAGPQVRHDARIFCFIYKFRQRFPVIGAAIAERLGLSPGLAPEQGWQLFAADDSGCCSDDCDC
ncbi:NAD(P)/FAD-dependent oxidoreductase [Stutzerimonas nitrititolerans]|uniref:NAD(P)/FAD-dependent oxidoreductase n=1 Tax=Stutzerimonas nitrititolerans TaxID=2482751 RepID=UPI000EE898A4|nr:NAD(P)/FAD-dependent oxidoreductase [Stutzerimonas nitrititolerans]HCL78125.1 thioredoxin reductase [Pseudomonas sp.]